MCIYLCVCAEKVRRGLNYFARYEVCLLLATFFRLGFCIMGSFV